MTCWHLSPYCVLQPAPAGAGYVLMHALYGSRFELDAELLALLARPLADECLEQLTAAASPMAEALRDLRREQVLIDDAERHRLEREGAFRNRLSALELAVHRGFNEGGFFPEGLEPQHRPTAFSPARPGPAVPLQPAPVSEAELTLPECLARRQSIRSYAEQPLALAQLERFLDLTLRAHAVMEVPVLGEVSLRNYPSGGARYPLEAYLAVYDVADLPPGIYHYHALHHRLEPLPVDAAPLQQLLAQTRRRMGDPRQLRGRPAVLLLIPAVFPRTCWKYRGVPYQLVLQEVGALHQTMYLAATALDLAPCAIGAFPERAVAELLGLDSRDEAQVGMFALGVPVRGSGQRAPLAVRAVRLRPDSPFSPDPAARSVELHLEDGTVEVQHLADLRLERGAGAAECAVLRGRFRGMLEAADADRIALWQRGLGLQETGGEVAP